MTSDELLAEFRALGGTAQNVRLGVGELGRGVFVIEPNEPAALIASENLLVPAEAIEVRDGALAIKPNAGVGAREIAFFESLHRHFGWSAGLFDALWESQRQWSELPAEVVALLRSLGALADPDWRFAAPTEFGCLYQFVRSRDILYGQKPYVATLADFVNHSGAAGGWTIENGVGVRGRFAGEMLVRYNARDAWANAMTYGFADRSPFAYSIGITVDLYGKERLSVKRDIAAADVRDRIRFPRVRVEGSLVELSFLMLGNTNAADLPRGVFRNVMADRLTAAQADEVFASIARFNSVSFLNALRTLRRHDGPLVRMLQDAAIDQLEALSSAVGARPISSR